ncbi:MAG: SsrA-binding protein SmpB [Verrucomicrobiales bacterium]
MGEDITVNRKALRDYHVVETVEAGIELRGTEVKSIRQGHLNLQDAFARIEKGQAWLHQCDILPYDKASHEQHEARRPRRLLLHKREINKLYGHVMVKGMALVALKAYWKNGCVKIQLALAKGKASHDKREDVKKKEAGREVQRELARWSKGGR